MFRSLIIFVVSFAVLAAGFFFVWHARSSTVIGGQPLVSLPLTVVPLSSNGGGKNGVGPSSRPWAKSFEKGRLVSEFYAAECTPRPDGTFELTSPISRLYLADGQVVTVTGESGTVNTDNGGPVTKGNLFGGSAASPRNGTLHKVHIGVFPSASITRPTMQVDTDNIKFDNDTLRMFTDASKNADGTVTPADQVPVKIRGDDFDFDGNGLIVKWNGRDGHLQLLQVSHGKELVLKNAAKMSVPGMPSATEPGPAKAAQVTPWPDMLVSIDPAAVKQAKPPAPAAPASTAVPYRAVFNDNVHILEDARQMAVADTMAIDFMMGSQPASTPAVLTSPSAQNAPSASAYKRTVSTPTTSTTSRPAGKPVKIQWTGQLTVKPLDATPPMMPLLTKQSVVRLVGSPAILTPEGAEVRAASATYRTPDGAVQLQSSPVVPVVQLTQTRTADRAAGFELTTSSLDYDPATQIATLGGPSALTVPMANQPKPMTVNWAKTGLIHTVVAKGQSQPGGVDRIDLQGEVAVAHPTFLLNSDQLHITLAVVPGEGEHKDQSAEEPKRITATGKVDCKLLSPGKPDQGIRSDKLAIAMEKAPAGKTYPRNIAADGNVYAYDPDQHLSADRLEVLLAPKPATVVAADVPAKADTRADPTADLAGSAELESLHATSNVKAVMKDGATADCDDLRVTTVAGGKQNVELSGEHGATLTNGKGSKLTGPVVHLSPGSNTISVDGPGSMHTIQSTAGDAAKPAAAPGTAPGTTPGTPRPIDLAWSDSLNVDGAANTADIVGHVVVNTLDSDGTVSTVTGEKAHIDFVDIAPPTTRRSAASADPTAMGNKQLKRLTLAGHVHGESILKDGQGKLIRHAELFGDQLVYTAADGKAVIPGPGKMTMENHRPKTAAAATGDEGGSNQGKMNVVWSKELVYDQASQVITIDGDTHSRFKPDAPVAKQGETDPPMQLDAQRLVVTLKNEKPTGVAPAGTVSPGEPGRVKLSNLLAVGKVHFSAKAVDFDAHSVEYDPDRQTITARASDAEPGETSDTAGRGGMTFDTLVYDMQKQEIDHLTGAHATIRR